MHTFIIIIEIAATVAFSVSGAMTGIKKQMDIFGVMILGLVTAVGGGVIRDLTLGITPPATFKSPIYAFSAVITAVIVFLPWVQRLFRRYQRVYDLLLLAMDSVGLGLFTVLGIQAAFVQLGDSCGTFLLCFVGVVTGVGGGILRDVLAGDTPYVFVKHIYASASLAGALICTGLWRFSHPLAMTVGALSVILIRFLSAHYRWSLPKAKAD